MGPARRKRAAVLGAGGFIGHHLVARLASEGYWVRGVDLKYPLYGETAADDFVQADLRDPAVCARVLDASLDEVYQLAADMGGAGFVFSGEHDAAIMHNSATINLGVLERCRVEQIPRIFYSSSACIYPEHNQLDPHDPNCEESSAYPANPDSEYGWEKLFSERLYASYHRNYGMEVRIARFHNIFGPLGTWDGGREKAPAALCRKVAETDDGGHIEIWGDGRQTRSFLYVDECLEGVMRLMASSCAEPINIGSDELISINDLASMTMDIAGKKLEIRHVDGPLGVRGRNSDNRLIERVLGWKPDRPLRDGMERTYRWIEQCVEAAAGT